MAAPAHKLMRVTLWIESPLNLSHPQEWDWNLIVNPTGTLKKDRSPVILFHADEAKLGTA